MTDQRFDDLTKALGQRVSRRGVVKGVFGVIFGGLLASAASGDGAARSRLRMACARLGQACDVAGVGAATCCPHLACQDATCCRPDNETCVNDADCCGANVCRPNPSGLGARCLPPGNVGAHCLEDADCQGTLTCVAGACRLPDGSSCVNDPECASGICDAYSGLCISAPLGNGQPCLASDDCVSDFCCLGFCKQSIGGSCLDGADCCSGACDPYALVCLAVPTTNGSTCAENGNCLSGLCCPEGVCGLGQGTACLDDPDCCGDLVCRPIDDNGRFQCLPPGLAGDRCDDSFGTGDCAAGLTCLGGVCAANAG